MLGMSVLIGAVTGFGGMYVSYYGDIASGATITLTGAAIFVAVYLAGLVRGRFGRLAVAEDQPSLGERELGNIRISG
jgi:hypothetical protein